MIARLSELQISLTILFIADESLANLIGAIPQRCGPSASHQRLSEGKIVMPNYIGQAACLIKNHARRAQLICYKPSYIYAS
jgi:hypothetical protein